jgi:hypothetical protein
MGSSANRDRAYLDYRGGLVVYATIASVSQVSITVTAATATATASINQNRYLP